MDQKIFLYLVLCVSVTAAASDAVIKFYAPSTLFIVRSDMEPASYTVYNEAIQEIKANLATKHLSPQDRQYLNTRLAILFLINNKIVSCLAKKIIKQLSDKITIAIASAIKRELVTVDVKNPVYIESKFQRNISATEEDYDKLVKSGIDLEKLKKIINSYISCDDFDDLVQSRRTGRLFGARFYLDINKIDKLNNYLKFIEPAVALAVLPVNHETQKTLQALGAELGTAGITKDVVSRFEQVNKTILSGIETGSPATAQDLFSFSVTLRTLGA